MFTNTCHQSNLGCVLVHKHITVNMFPVLTGEKKYAHSHSLTRSTNKLRKGASQNVYCKAWQQSKLRLPFFNQLLVEVGKEGWAIHRHIMYSSERVSLTGIKYKRNPNQILWNKVHRLMTPRDVETNYATELDRFTKKSANSFLHLAPGVSAWWSSI